jgi:hypothetical protein
MQDTRLKKRAQRRREGRYRLSVAHLLAALVALIVVQPMVDQLPYGALIESLVFTVVLFAAVNAVGGQRRTHAIGALLVAPAVLTRWMDHFWPELLPIDLSLIAALLFVAFVTAHLFRFVIVARRVNDEVLYAAITVFLLLAIVWSLFYALLARWDPQAFVFTEPAHADATLQDFLAVYFSVQVITTITFGDIMPVSNLARMAVLLEATVGMFYLAILVSRLVGAYTVEPPADESLDRAANGGPE